MNRRTWRSALLFMLLGGALFCALDVAQELWGPKVYFEIIAAIGGHLMIGLAFLAAGTAGAMLGLAAWAISGTGVRPWQLAIGSIIATPCILGWGAYVVLMNRNAFPKDGTCEQRRAWLQATVADDTIAVLHPALENARVVRDIGRVVCSAPAPRRHNTLMNDMNGSGWNVDLEVLGAKGKGVLEIRGTDDVEGTFTATWVFAGKRETFKLPGRT